MLWRRMALDCAIRSDSLFDTLRQKSYKKAILN